jgi:RimJ/RimL family protein N-acetyltransferase
MIEILPLPAVKEAINIFGKAYLESNEGDYNGLIHVVNIWKTDLYTVYAIQSEGKLMGLAHGWCRGDDYYGHFWFSKEFRGSEASEGALKVIDRIMNDFGINKVSSVVPADNKKCRLFLKNIGFTSEGDKFSYERTN